MAGFWPVFHQPLTDLLGDPPGESSPLPQSLHCHLRWSGFLSSPQAELSTGRACRLQEPHRARQGIQPAPSQEGVALTAIFLVVFQPLVWSERSQEVIRRQRRRLWCCLLVRS